MKTQLLTTFIALFIVFPAPAEVTLERNTIELQPSGESVLVKLELKNPSEQSWVDDITLTLLDSNYQPLAKAVKKVILLNGTHFEEIALPLDKSIDAPKDCMVQIEFAEQLWLKRFSETKKKQEIHVLGQREWLSGSKASLRVIVTQSPGQDPIEDAKIKILSAPQDNGKSYVHKETHTDEHGTASISFEVPESLQGERELTVKVESELGTDEISSPIRVLPGTKILVMSDKPVYQPGQLIHIRTLTAHKATGKPVADRDITLEVYDGKNNKVFKQILKTSEFGIAAADFQLADEVNQGNYKIKAIMDEDISEKSVRVYEYVLPKFRIHLNNDKKFYTPGQMVKGKLESNYFFGRPVSEAKVTMVANCFDVGFNEFAKVEGKTDAEGKFEYEFAIPQKLVGQPSFKGKTVIQMDVRVRDTADHEEQKIHTFFVAPDPLQIEAVPESGQLVADVMNEIYLVTSRPDGSVAIPELKVESRFLQSPIELKSDEQGITAIQLTPTKGDSVYRPELPTLKITAEIDDQTVVKDIDIPIETDTQQILLRPNKGIYSMGDELKLDVFGSFSDKEPVFVDLIKNNQTVLTKTVRLQKKKASLQLPLDHTLAGTLQINAYVVRADGHMIRDTRQVIVTRDDDLDIDIKTDQERYEPGVPAKLSIAVRDAKGNPVRAAIGMHVVDESVYSLAEKEPGLAKVFFAIEKELLEPKVEIHGYQMDKVVRLSARAYQENANLSKALLAKVDKHSDFSLNENTLQRNRSIISQDLQKLQEAFLDISIPLNNLPRPVDEILLEQGKELSAFSLSDPWNQPYMMYEDNNLFLASPGTDGELQTQDDIKTVAFRTGYIVRDKKSNVRLYKKRFDRDGEVLEGEGRRLGQEDNIQMQRAGGAGVGGVDQDVRGEAFAMPMAKAVESKTARVDKLDSLQFGLADEPQRERRRFGEDLSAGRPDIRDNFAEMAQKAEMSALKPAEDQANTYYFSMVDRDDDTLSEEELKQAQDSIGESLGPLVVNGEIDEKQLQKAAEQFAGIDELRLEETIAEISEMSEEEKQEWLKKQKIILSDEEQKEEESVRVRRYFPETLFYTPEMITDEQGLITMTLPAADSITTWRMSAMANDKSGAIGDTTSAMNVFKPFFIDLDLPIALIKDDEVTIPVAVYNYLDEPQIVEVELEKTGWFDLLEGEYKRTVQVAAEEVTSVSYRIQAKKLGEHPITVYGWGSKDNDAIGRSIEVRPNGESHYQTENGRLSQNVQKTITYPQGRIEGADQLFVKIYPGMFSQVVEGLDAILHMPFGCFEQTSSTTYPNILALNYMQQTDQITPEIEMKAREYINLGYQRLLTFEINDGGFEVFGNPPANRILSAYGLMEFIDMAQVYPIDENVITRTREWLYSQMKEDGTWEPDQQYAHAEMWKSIQENDLLVTAYVAYALEKASMGPRMNPNIASNQMAPSRSDNLDPRLKKSKNYLLNDANEAEDAYTLSILCNALLSLAPSHETTKKSVNRLVDLGALKGDTMHWEAEASMSFARGNHASVETTAWACLALLKDGRFSQELNKALNWLIEQKDPNGTWGTTHGTVMALKALLYSLQSRTQKADATVIIHVNDEQAEKIEITPEYSDIFRQINVSQFAKANENEVEITLEGEGQLLYQIVGKYFMPWQEHEAKDSFDIKVEYDRSELRRNDTVTAQIIANNKLPFPAEMVMIDIGIPPGFQVQTPDLDEYVENRTIEKYTVMSRQLLIYIKTMDGKQELTLEVPMKATLPMVAKAPESTIYEYYNPENKKTAPPQELKVK